jgi:hypothetical protein
MKPAISPHVTQLAHDIRSLLTHQCITIMNQLTKREKSVPPTARTNTTTTQQTGSKPCINDTFPEVGICSRMTTKCIAKAIATWSTGKASRTQPNLPTTTIVTATRLAYVAKNKAIHVPVECQITKQQHQVAALLNSGAMECFLSPEATQQMGILTMPLRTLKQVKNVNGTTNISGAIKNQAYLTISINGREKMLQFYLANCYGLTSIYRASHTS